MLTIGLTGGICSGKSTAARYFMELGVGVIDADTVARDLLTHDVALHAQVIEQFGPVICDAQGHIDRGKLRGLIFSDETAKTWLEQLLHPLIRQQIKTAISQANGPYVIVAIPLLVETQQEDYIDRILLVDVPQDLQLSRLTQRDGMDRTHAQAMINAQARRDQRLAQATDVIENTHSYQILKENVAHYHDLYTKLAADFS